MKITIEHYKEKFTFETEHDGLTIDGIHEIWERCLLAIGFQQQTIEDFYNPEKE